ncbi:MAG: dihydroneopterin aldolase [Actinomycetota bacterium]
MSGPDRIALRGLRGHGRHGVLPAERATGQEFRVDVVVALDTRRAARTDDLADTVDYGDLAGRVVALVEGEPVALLETLAARVAEAALADPRVVEVEVTVHKPQAPLTVPFDDVTVTVTRGRE